MSVSRCYTIHCNICAEWVQGIEDAPLTKLRRAAARMGWTSGPRQNGHRSTHDWCPGCSKKRKKQEPRP